MLAQLMLCKIATNYNQPRKTAMSKFNKFAIAAIIGASALVGTASAATITFGGVAASDSSGLTSQFIDPFDAQGTNGFFIETFDQNGVVGETGFNDAGFDDRCSVNSGAGALPGVAVTPTPADDINNTLGVRAGTVPGVAAAPLNDETCFGYVTNATSGGTAQVTFDYSVLLDANDDTGITYLGFYWGSVDTFNNFSFFSGGELVTRITGTELLDQLNGQSGNQNSENSNVYVNIFFNFNEQFDTLVLSTTGVAAEFDNIVIGLSQRPVPAPAGIAFLACSLILLSVRSRFKK